MLRKNLYSRGYGAAAALAGACPLSLNEEIHQSNCRDMAAIVVGMGRVADVDELRKS